MYKLLIIEDEHLIRKWLVAYLANKFSDNLLIYDAEDGKEGIEKINQIKPNIVITDIEMPIFNAFEIFQRTQDIVYKKIIISAYSNFENAKQALSYEVVNFIAKPIDTHEIDETLQNVIADLDYEAKQFSQNVLQPLNVTTTDTLIVNIIEWLKANYNQDFTIDQVAKHFAVSESNLYKKFKEETSMTIVAYLSHYRMIKAVELISNNPDIYTYELARQVGIKDESYFRKLFKKHTNMTIKAFKQKWKNRE